MYTIEQKGENLFVLLKDGEVVSEFLTYEDAEKARAIAEGNPVPAWSDPPTGTWVDDGAGLEYPEGTDNYHSGEETPLTFEERFDAVLRYLADVHGIHLPAHLAPKD